MKSGLCSVTFRAMPVEEIVPLVAASGLSVIEWGGDVHVPHGDVEKARRTADLTVAAGLEAVSYGSYYRAGVSEAQGLPFSSVLKTAQALGANRIRIWAGASNAEDVDSTGWTAIADDIRRVTQYAASAGISVVLEFHNNTLTNTYASARRLLEELPETGLIWQPLSRLSAEENLAGLRLLGPWVRHVHCFHSAPPTAPLEAGAEFWKSYLAELYALPLVRYVLLEFVKGAAADQFLDDAHTLKRLMGASNAVM